MLHGRDRYSVANCYMGVRGTVRPTVTWEGEVQCGQLLHGRESLSSTKCYMGGIGTVWPTVTWEGEVQCGQLLHGRERYRANQLLHRSER